MPQLIRVEVGADSLLQDEAALLESLCLSRGIEVQHAEENAPAGRGLPPITIRFTQRCEVLFPPGSDLPPFSLDFTNHLLQQRSHQAKTASEAVARAVLGRGGTFPSRIYDASAGLGRDALIIQSCGVQVEMCERHPVMWLLLYDALRRAHLADARLFPCGLPELLPCAELSDLGLNLEGSVIYFDPMFPVRRKHALVKKELRSIRAIVQDDDDSQEVLAGLLTLRARRVVVKRPAQAPVLHGGCSGMVPGGQCRFDIYSGTHSGAV